MLEEGFREWAGGWEGRWGSVSTAAELPAVLPAAAGHQQWAGKAPEIAQTAETAA